jgi:hypothetical protein
MRDIECDMSKVIIELSIVAKVWYMCRFVSSRGNDGQTFPCTIALGSRRQNLRHHSAFGVPSSIAIVHRLMGYIIKYASWIVCTV